MLGPVPLCGNLSETIKLKNQNICIFTRESSYCFSAS